MPYHAISCCLPLVVPNLSFDETLGALLYIIRYTWPLCQPPSKQARNSHMGVQLQTGIDVAQASRRSLDGGKRLRSGTQTLGALLAGLAWESTPMTRRWPWHWRAAWCVLMHERELMSTDSLHQQAGLHD